MICSGFNEVCYLQVVDIPALLAKLNAVGLEHFFLAERSPADSQAQQVRRAGHRNIHGKQALDDPLTRPGTAVAFLPSKPWQKGIDEVFIVVRFEHKRCSMGLPLAGVNRAKPDVQDVLILSAPEGIYWKLDSAFV